MLDQTVTITIPSTQGVKGKIKKIEHKARASEVLAIMATMFGGATATEGLGSYMADDGTLVIEAVIIVESKTNKETLKSKQNEFSDSAKFYRNEWQQESVAFTINQTMYFA